MANNGNDPIPGWARPLAWGAAAALILGPLFAMKAAGHLQWDVADLPFALGMIGIVGLTFELAVRTSAGAAYRTGAAVALTTVFLLSWANLAVGLIGSEDDPLNRIYSGVIAVALVGSLLSGFRARGMARAMAAAAVAQLAAGGVALVAGAFTGPLTIFFTALWLCSAWLFRKAARTRKLAAV